MTSPIPTQLAADRFAVRTTGLTKRFRKQLALDQVDFTVPEGAFYVLVGPNGAGKTTFFKLLLELIVPTAGEIDVLGMNPVRDGANVRAHVGYIPESSQDLYMWMNVDDMLGFHRRYFPAWDHEYAASLMKQLNVKQGKLQRLSKGEVRRVQLVMALAHRPPLLLLDEPSDGLDPMGREILYGILADYMATTPTTVIVSTHLVFELERLADHIAVLNDGKLAAQVSTADMHRHFKRYVLHGGGENGSAREQAHTLWGEEAEVAARLVRDGVTVRDVRPLTLQEAAVAFLGMERI
jgi:ABC-2 type transport system ATP-binding protein